jgi:hypothetical protein
MSAEPYVGVQYAVVNQGSTAGTANLVANTTGKSIVVVGFMLSMSAAGTIKFTSHGGPDITGAMAWPNTPIVQPANVWGPILRTAPGQGLDLTSTTGGANGVVAYQII